MLKSDDIRSLLKKELQQYEKTLEVSEWGKVISVGDGVCRAYGLKNVMAGETVSFANGEKALALNLERDSVSLVLLCEDRGIREGEEVRRTGRILQIPVGESLLGRVVDTLGRPLDGLGAIDSEKFSALEKKAPGIIERQPRVRAFANGH